MSLIIGANLLRLLKTVQNDLPPLTKAITRTELVSHRSYQAAFLSRLTQETGDVLYLSQFFHTLKKAVSALFAHRRGQGKEFLSDLGAA